MYISNLNQNITSYVGHFGLVYSRLVQLQVALGWTFLPTQVTRVGKGIWEMFGLHMIPHIGPGLM